MILPGLGLFRPVLALPAHRLVEIDVVAVEFGAFHTGETGLAGHGDAAGAAHAGTTNSSTCGLELTVLATRA